MNTVNKAKMEAKADTRNHLTNKNTSEELLKCPSCDVSLSKFEVAQHCEQEMDRLRQLQLRATPEVAVGAANGFEDSNVERRKPWTVFQKVQRNRQTRLKQRSRRRPVPPTEFPCPVCNGTYPQDEIQRHAERCIRRSGGVSNGRDEHSSNDEDDGDEFEEYEWAGQKRIRVSSLLQGGYASIGVGQTITNHQNGGQQQDEEEDLNVDEDDTQIYGPPQYGEADVILLTAEQNCGNEEVDVTSYMRRLITGACASTANVAPSVETLNNRDFGAVIAPSTDDINVCIPKFLKDITQGSVGASSTTLPTQHYQQVIESLKAKLRHYENHVPSKFKCLICLDDYRNPAISVSCWHVHCEDCWLRSLGARKLCPQCNLITTPKDLRRIYM